MFRLDIAVDYADAMGEVDGAANRAEEPQAFLESQIAIFAVGVDGLAPDKLHDKVGHAVGGGAPVEQPGDVGVFQAGHDLPLEPEVTDHEVEIEAGPHDFDRDFLPIHFVCPYGAVDRSHAAAADALDNLVWAEQHAHQGVRGRGGRQGFESIAVRFVGFDQGDYFIEKFAVSGTCAGEVFGALGGFEAEGYVIVGLYEAGEHYPAYHRTDDTMEKVDFAYVTDMARLTLATLLTEGGLL